MLFIDVTKLSCGFIRTETYLARLEVQSSGLAAICHLKLGTVARARSLSVFVPPDQRSVPPPWDPKRRPDPDAKRHENAAVIFIVLISIMALFAPIAGGTFVAAAMSALGY